LSEALLQILGVLMSIALPFASFTLGPAPGVHAGLWKRALLAILLAIPILTAIPVVAAFVSGAALFMAFRLATDR
jgi:hypothetical protein